MNVAEVVGFLGSAVSFVLWLPQAGLAWRNRHDRRALAGLSLGTFILVLCNAALWAAYAVLTKAWWVGVPGLVNAPLALMMIVLVLQARMGGAPTAITLCGCRGGYLASDPHDFVVTAPPGYGYVHSPCSGVVVSGFAVPLGQGEMAASRMRAMS